MRRSLERSDTLINLRNQEIAALNSRLAAKDETIAELGEQIDRLESELETERADREKFEAELADLKQKSAAAGKDLPDAADLYNRLKAKRKKSNVTLADVRLILEMMEE